MKWKAHWKTFDLRPIGRHNSYRKTKWIIESRVKAGTRHLPRSPAASFQDLKMVDIVTTNASEQVKVEFLIRKRKCVRCLRSHLPEIRHSLARDASTAGKCGLRRVMEKLRADGSVLFPMYNLCREEYSRGLAKGLNRWIVAYRDD